jgi:hypothetical protein
MISLLTLLLISADRPVDTIRFTVINKSGMDIAIQLRANDYENIFSKDILRGELYYLTILEGDREHPNFKIFDIQKDTYVMQVYYIETYDPVYGFKCATPAPNPMIAQRNIRLVVLPCDFTPGPKQVGEPSMRKYLPFSVAQYAILFEKYWLTRLVY